MGYRSILNRTGVQLSNQLSLSTSQVFRDSNKNAWSSLLTSSKQNLQLHTSYKASFVDFFDTEFAENGFRDDALVSHALRLVKQMTKMPTERENGGWRRFLEYDLFSYFSFFDRFSSSQDLSWTYDEFPLVTARSSLIQPKPDFAFGLLVTDESAEDSLALRMSELSEPTISASCVPTDRLRIMFPFLILESTSLRGDPLSANHQMAHSFVKALDVVAASGQEQNLFIVGICQIGFTFELYLGHCISDQAQFAKPRKYNIDRLASGDLRNPVDMIRLFRFLAAAGEYGEHYFRDSIVHSLTDLYANVSTPADMAAEILELPHASFYREAD